MNPHLTLKLLCATHDWIASLTPAQFVATQAPVVSSSIGAHLRHVIDHYDALAAPTAEPAPGCPRIDYVSRARDPRLESSIPHASEALDRVANALRTLTSAPDWSSHPCKVRVSTDPSAPDLDSTLARELAFVTSHAVHHLALISMIARFFAIPFPENLGIAPSTQAYRQTRTDASKPVSPVPAHGNGGS